MKKAIIVQDELYPFYILDTDEMAIKIAYGEVVEVSEEFLVKYHKVMKDFDIMQNLLRKKSEQLLEIK